MRTAAIATMGTSPPVVSEFVEYIQRTDKLHHLTILSTKEKIVQSGAILSRIVIQARYPHVDVVIQEIPISDVTTEEENYVFMEESVKIISKLRHKYDILHICLAGGRKEMVASMMMIAQLMGLNSVYHIVSPHIREMNIELERIRHEIEQLAASEDPQKYYELHRDKFDRVMFPPPTSYGAIKLPILPYPEEYIVLISRILGGVGKISNKALLDQLKKAGLISITKQGKIVVTEDGKKLYNHIMRYL